MKHHPRRDVPAGPIIPLGTLAQALSELPDPCRPLGWHLQHPPLPLVSLLLLTSVALRCGATSQSAIAQWGRERRDDPPDVLLALGFPAGQSPAGVTLHRLYRRLDVAAVEQVVRTWAASTGVTPDEPLAIEGQTLRAVAASDVPCSHVPCSHVLSVCMPLTLPPCWHASWYPTKAMNSRPLTASSSRCPWRGGS